MQPNNTTTQTPPQYTPTTGIGTQSGGFTYTAGGWTATPPATPTPTTANPVINTQQLTGNTQQPQLPTPAPQTNPSAFVNQTNVAGSMPQVQQPAQPGVQQVQPLNTQFGDNKGVYNRIQGLYNQLTGKGGRQIQLEEQANIPQVNKEIADLTEQIATKKAAFDQAAVDVTGKPIGIERQTGKIAQIQRNEAVTIGGLSALLQAKQGNLESARNEIDRTLKLEFEPIETQITALKDFYTMNQNDLTESQKLRLQEQISNRQKERDFFYDIKKQAYDSAISSGSNDAIEKIINAKTPSEVSAAQMLIQSTGSGVPKDISQKIVTDKTGQKVSTNINFVDALNEYKNKYKEYADKDALKSPEAISNLGTMREALTTAYSLANLQGTITDGDRSSYKKIVAGGIFFPKLRLQQMDTLSNRVMGSIRNDIRFLDAGYSGYATPFFSNQLSKLDSALSGTNPSANLTGADFFSSILNNAGTSSIFNPQTGFILPGQTQ